MLVDRFGRQVTYLRVSVTERCNFRCRYCMAEKPFSWVPRENLLSYEELFRFIKIAIDSGITKIRLTGGEPTTRENLDELIAMIHIYAPQVDIGLTTNGYLLAPLADRFKKAGLKRINISLDSLDPDIARHIAQKEVLDSVLRGIDAALEAGLNVKINSVILKNINEHEIVDLFQFARTKGSQIRYIEYMENTFAHGSLKGLTSQEILEVLKKEVDFSSLPQEEGGPANLYETTDGYRFGTIEPHRHDFCSTCDRLRLSAEGDLIGCLYFEGSKSIKDAIRHENTLKAKEILEEVVLNKPEKNLWGSEECTISNRAFYETGG